MTVRFPLRRASYLLGAVLMLAAGLTGQPALAAGPVAATDADDRVGSGGHPPTRSALAVAFDRAQARYQVPADLLAALGYAETRLDGHGGAPSASGGYGVLHLTSNPTVRTLDLAADLTGLDRAVLRTDTGANILGAAAVLRSYADSAGLDAARRADPNHWYVPVARYGGASDPAVARLYADAVYDLLATGFATPSVESDPTGLLATGSATPAAIQSPAGSAAADAASPFAVPARQVAPHRGEYASVAPLGSGPTGGAGILSTDYPPAAWAPAHSGNYTVSSRESSYPINYVIIHVAQGSYAGTVNWFQNAAAGVSAHYTFRSSDGAVTQSVRDKDVAWHAGNWTYNTQSIGIEHEGYVNQASWFTDAMYRASAALTRHLCDRYGIPKDRAHIIGHNQVPGATHTDPGPYWNWTTYMQYVTGSGGGGGWTSTVDNTTAGRFTASANWGTSTYSAQRQGVDYRYAEPVEVSDVAWYRFDVPATASYRVEVWYPGDPGYNAATPYVVVTSTGNQTVRVDQRGGGGQWRSLGNFTLSAGDANKVGVSRWASGTGYVIADAVRLTRV
ncbi:N-acetylmuramoyl-L-alanine amidase [Micromonospora sp. NPDC050397]|uniref:golvesin C-terminal-like domain-containing protein n=1 Tax=Micromonospora sp. NPDC050397 TaxID=3364279 RepID=UPI00384B652F